MYASQLQAMRLLQIQIENDVWPDLKKQSDDSDSDIAKESLASMLENNKRNKVQIN
jgi:tartrate dehydratase alpha subunit/fumarate hydratase class I-like protein